MRAGAIGFSTSTSPAHNGEGGLPMPSRLADENELRTLVGSLREAGRGVFMLTKGGHTQVSFLEELAAESTRPVVIAALLHSSTNPDAVFQDLRGHRPRPTRAAGAWSARCRAARSRWISRLRSPYVFEGLESWQPALALKGAAYEAKLAERRFRDAVRDELARPAHFRLFNGEWDKVQVIESSRRETEQRSIGELAREAGKDPLDFMLDLALDESLDTVFSALLLNSDEEAVGRMLRHPREPGVAFRRRGAPHVLQRRRASDCTSSVTGCASAACCTLAEAARRLTSHPAQRVRHPGARRAEGRATTPTCSSSIPRAWAAGRSERVFDLPGRPSAPHDRGRRRAGRVGQRRAPRRAEHGRDSARPGRLLRDFSA